MSDLDDLRTADLVYAELERQADMDGLVIAADSQVANALGIPSQRVGYAVTRFIESGRVVHEGYSPAGPQRGRLRILRLVDTG